MVALAKKPDSPETVPELFFAHRNNQPNWFTYSIGGQRIGLSPSRVYDMDTGRFLQRDPLPSVAAIVRSVGTRGLGIWAYSKCAEEFIRYAERMDATESVRISGRDSIGYKTLLGFQGRMGDLWRRKALMPIRHEGANGMNLFAAAFVPSGTDPSGLYTIDKNCCCHIESEIKGNLEVIKIHMRAIGMAEDFINWLAARKWLESQGLRTAGLSGVGAVNRSSRPACVNQAIDQTEVDIGQFVARRTLNHLVGGLVGLESSLLNWDIHAGNVAMTTIYLNTEMSAHAFLHDRLKSILRECQAKYAGCCGKAWQQCWCYSVSQIGPPTLQGTGEPPSPPPPPSPPRTDWGPFGPTNMIRMGY